MVGGGGPTVRWAWLNNRGENMLAEVFKSLAGPLGGNRKPEAIA